MPETLKKMGLEKYLDATKGLHNNKGYAELLDMLDLKIPKTEIAKEFNVSKATIHLWIKRIGD